MFRRHLTNYALVGLLAASVSVALAGCKQQEVQAKTAAVSAGDMPADGEWSGVYYSPLYGFLHIVAEGSTANGAWRTTAGDKWGELNGTIEGDLLKYSWVEHTIGLVGANAGRKGKGYFKYTAPSDADAHVIAGEWGLNEDERGYKWEATKQTNMEPNPDSVRPDEVEGQVSGAGGWDEGEDEGGDEGGDEGDEGSDDEGDEDSSEL